MGTGISPSGGPYFLLFELPLYYVNGHIKREIEILIFE
jgi:hypothetical protein